MYVLDCLHKDMSVDEVILKCDGDSQMVTTWIDFLQDQHWIAKELNKWILTDKGRVQLTNYYPSNETL